MKIWLDDLRPMPSGFDVHVKTAQDAITELASGNVDFISLDHDLGPPEAGSGYDVAKYIEEQAYLGNLSKLVWSIHSANSVGIKNMRIALENADKYWS